jgi:hypothetical protein
MSRLWREGLPIRMMARGDLPAHFFWNNQAHHVLYISNRWRVQTGWWRFAIQRTYFKLVTQSDLVVVVYRDETVSRWFLAQVFD